jgi:hypothetical protein
MFAAEEKDMGRMIHRLVLLVPCLVIGAWAQDVTLTLENAVPGNVMGGAYTSPYGISVGSGSPVMLICDDFTTDISIGDTWVAGVTTLSEIDSSAVAGLKFGTDPNAVQDYAVAAVLAAEVMALPNIGTPAENTEAAGELSNLRGFAGVAPRPNLPDTAPAGGWNTSVRVRLSGLRSTLHWSVDMTRWTRNILKSNQY